MKLKFEEAISVPESGKHSVADSIDYHSIGLVTILLLPITISCVLNHKLKFPEPNAYMGS